MKSVNETKKVLLIFADSAVKNGKADAGLLQQYLQQASDQEALNTQVFVTNARSLSYFVSNQRSAIYDHRNKLDLKDYDFVYFRKAGAVMQQMLACAVYLRQHGVPFFDTEIGSAGSRNKLSQMFLFQEKSLPIPTTLFCRNRQRLMRLVTEKYADELPFPVIAKATGGTRGDANYLLDTPEELEALLQREKRHFLIQSFIPNDGDYRALVVFQKLRGLIGRSGVPGSHLNNTSKSGTAEWLPLETFDSRLTMISVRAAQVCKRDIAGVDIIINKETGEPAILEVNRAPQIENASYPEKKAVVVMQGIMDAINEPVNVVDKDEPKRAVGRKEYVEIAELPEVGRLIAKVDTGAYSNSMHVSYVKELVDADGNKQLQYSAVEDKSVVHTTDKYFRKTVISSNGIPEERYVVEMHVIMGGRELSCTMSLADRGTMRYPVLIGRLFLKRHKLMVDPSKRFSI